MLQAATAEIDDFDGALCWMLQQDVFRLQITMYNAVMAHEAQRQEHLVRKPPDERCREADEAVGFDEFVKVHAQ
jgi:hypothetical protein